MNKNSPIDSQILDIVQVVSAGLTSLMITVDRMAGTLAEMDQRLVRVENRLTKVESRLDEVEKHTKLIPGMAQAIIDFSTGLDLHDRRIQKLEKALA